MEITLLCGVFVFVFVSGSWSSADVLELLGLGGAVVPGYNLKVGNFQVLKKHPALKKCAAAILTEVKIGQFVFGFPGVFNEGSKVDVFISITEPHTTLVWALLLSYNFEDNSGDNVRIFIKNNPSRIAFEERIGYPIESHREELNNAWPVAFSSKQVIKVSLLANADSITVLVEDKEINTFKLIGRVAFQRVFIAYTNKAALDSNPLFLHGVQFTAK